MPICPITGLSFEHHELERKHYERFGLPVPDIHPLARRIQKMAHANSWDLYWTNDARTGKKILSCYDPSEHLVIYDRTYWMSDEFDGRAYGREFDFSRPFFEQYFEMVARIPKPNLTTLASEQVDYCNNIYRSKNCYLSFNMVGSENVMYCVGGNESRDSIRLYNCRGCELSYACSNCFKGYYLRWSEFCMNCTDSAFLSNCTDCTQCYQCVNLRHKSYCIQNKQYTKEQYEECMRGIDLGSWQTFQKEEKIWREFLGTQPLQAQKQVNCEDSTGVLMANCKSCVSCANLTNADQCFSCWGNIQSENSDSTGEDGQYNTNTLGVVSTQRAVNCLWVERSYDIFYSKYAIQSHDCFGCFGVKKMAYGILNRAYSIHEYEALKEKIIAHMKETGEWGQYFPVRFALFPYEKTLAKAFMMAQGLDGDPEVIKRFGFRTEENGETVSTSDARLASELPDDCDDADDTLTATPFLCAESGRPYNITRQELAFYKKQRIPLPRISWRTAIEHEYPFFYPTPHQTLCGECGVPMYSYIRPEQTARRILCDQCFTAMMT